jgi:hypothetical protein
MDALWLILRAEVRRRWRPMIGLALLLGVIGGVVLTAAAGADRTDTAYPRLLQWARAAQVQLLPVGNTLPTRYFRALARLPQVAAMSTTGLYQAMLPARGRQPLTPVETISSPDRALGITADRVKVLAGHRFDPRAAGQAMIDQKLANLEHLRPGGQLHLLLIPNNPKTGNPEPQLASQLTFRVSAVVTFDSQIVPGTGATGEPTALLSPPFTATAAAASTSYGTSAGIRLRSGASMPAFLSAAAALAKQYPATGGKVDVISLSSEMAATERAIHPQAVALALFAGLAGVIALTVIVQLLARQLTLDSAEFPVLRALGMTRSRLVGLSLARTAAVTVAGGLVAVAIAIAASPVMPIGAARLAEPAPGVQVNLAVLAAGFAVFALVPLALLSPAAWAAATRAQGPLGVAEPGRPGRGLAAGRAGGPNRARHWRHRRADGVRAGPRPDRGASAQCPDRDDRRDRLRAGRRGLRHQPDQPGRHPPPVRAELGPAAGSRIRRGDRPAGRKDRGHRSGRRHVCGGQLRPAQRGRLPDHRARDRHRPGPGAGLPDAAGRPGAGRRGRDRAGRPDHAGGARPARAGGPGHGQPGG